MSRTEIYLKPKLILNLKTLVGLYVRRKVVSSTRVQKLDFETKTFFSKLWMDCFVTDGCTLNAHVT
jgi:hypothetical protein